MRKIVVTEFVTLDGVMQDPGGAEKNTFKHGGWSMPYWSDEFASVKNNELMASDAQLLGRVTYEGFAKAWPTMQGTGGFGAKMNSMKKYVVSTTLKTAEWNNSTIISDNVVEEITKLKNQSGGDILVAGSAKLVQFLMKNNLVDEFTLLVYPVVVGEGKRLFADAPKIDLKLVESKSFATGVILLRYTI